MAQPQQDNPVLITQEDYHPPPKKKAKKDVNSPLLCSGSGESAMKMTKTVDAKAAKIMSKTCREVEVGTIVSKKIGGFLPKQKGHRYRRREDVLGKVTHKLKDGRFKVHFVNNKKLTLKGLQFKIVGKFPLTHSLSRDEKTGKLSMKKLFDEEDSCNENDSKEDGNESEDHGGSTSSEATQRKAAEEGIMNLVVNEVVENFYSDIVAKYKTSCPWINNAESLQKRVWRELQKRNEPLLPLPTAVAITPPRPAHPTAANQSNSGS